MGAIGAWIVCKVFGHRWSAWVRVQRIDQSTNGGNAPVWTYTGTGIIGSTRMCSRGHFAWRGFDWDDAPHGVITAEPVS